MEATVELVGIGNYVRFPDGMSENRLFIRLPNGHELQAVISDSDLAQVVQAFAPAMETPDEAPPQAPVPLTRQSMQAEVEASASFAAGLFQEESLPDGSTALVFGGPEAPPILMVPSAPPPRRKGRIVDVDAAGNPVVEIEGAESLSDVTGTSGDKDEDGVAQL